MGRGSGAIPRPKRSRGDLSPDRPKHIGILKFCCRWLTRGQDGRPEVNFSKNNKSISIVAQSCKLICTTEYAETGWLAELFADAGRSGRTFRKGAAKPTRILPTISFFDSGASARAVARTGKAITKGKAREAGGGEARRRAR
jgi:hypothetical protein